MVVRVPRYYSRIIARPSSVSVSSRRSCVDDNNISTTSPSSPVKYREKYAHCLDDLEFEFGGEVDSLGRARRVVKRIL